MLKIFLVILLCTSILTMKNRIKVKQGNMTSNISSSNISSSNVSSTPSMEPSSNMTSTDDYSFEDVRNSSLFIPPFSQPYVMMDIFKVIPPNFFVNLNGTFGKDFMVLKDFRGNFFECGNDGSVFSRNSNFSKNVLWIPEVISADMISLRHYTGGYLRWNIQTNNFDCDSRVKGYDSMFRVGYVPIKANSFNDSTLPKLMVLMIMDGYLSVDNNGSISISPYIKTKNEFFRPMNRDILLRELPFVWSDIINLGYFNRTLNYIRNNTRSESTTSNITATTM